VLAAGDKGKEQRDKTCGDPGRDCRIWRWLRVHRLHHPYACNGLGVRERIDSSSYRRLYRDSFEGDMVIFLLLTFFSAFAVDPHFEGSAAASDSQRELPTAKRLFSACMDRALPSQTAPKRVWNTEEKKRRS
jgi:hypothetical protein